MQQQHRPQQIKLIKPSLSISISKQAASPTQSKELTSPTDLDSPTRRKKLQSLKKASDVEYARSQLNSYLDLLDNKVSKLVEKHQAEFLVAYRNHIKKVREEMEEIRNKALSNANSTVSQTEKIQALEKQLTIFREESLKLFEKVNQKQGIIYNLRTKINQLQTQKSFLQKSLRQLTKRNKHLQGRNYEIQSRKSAAESNLNLNLLNQKQFFISRPPNQQHTFDFKNMYKLDVNLNKPFSQSKSRPYTTAINSKGMSVRSRNHSIQINQPPQSGDLCGEVLAAIEKYLNDKVNQETMFKLKDKIEKIMATGGDVKKQLNATQDLGLTTVGRFPRASENLKKTKSLFESKNHAKRSQLQEYFYKSIEAVRKQITRRRGLKSMNFYSEYANLSLAEFKKVDFFRLLELLLSNQKIIEILHNAIFQEAQKYN